MRRWTVDDAKARFGELLDACLAEGPQMVIERGEEAAVLLSMQEWRRMRFTARPSLKELLLLNQPRTELVLPVRGQAKRRGELVKLKN